jgi:hypothetical protein
VRENPSVTNVCRIPYRTVRYGAKAAPTRRGPPSPKIFHPARLFGRAIALTCIDWNLISGLKVRVQDAWNGGPYPIGVKDDPSFKPADKAAPSNPGKVE